jgi:hypothetical protein
VHFVKYSEPVQRVIPIAGQIRIHGWGLFLKKMKSIHDPARYHILPVFLLRNHP